MSFEIENFDAEKHYELVCSWWTAHKWPVIPLEMLPSSGIVIGNLCAGFVYSTDSAMGMLEWIVSNPEASVMDRSKGLDILIMQLLERAKSLGIKAVFSYAKNKRLLDRYLDHGFQKSDEGMTHVVWRG